MICNTTSIFLVYMRVESSQLHPSGSSSLGNQVSESLVRIYLKKYPVIDTLMLLVQSRVLLDTARGGRQGVHYRDLHHFLHRRHSSLMLPHHILRKRLMEPAKLEREKLQSSFAIVD